ncbi:MAG: protein kinase [Gemmatimonadaceae bacterium]|nr:protein kinase [Gemmatimonadaceae bacterium]
MRDHLNTVLADRYLVEQEIGRGGMATVWLARDLRHARPVAIKILHPELAGAIGVDRFVREVRLTARLQHPNIVPVLDSGVLQSPEAIPLPWYAMAFIAGESLRTRLDRERQLPIEDALHIAEEAANALHYAHGEGIVHRDIKPENVLLSSNRVYVVDFGIAKALIETGGERLTSTGLAIGTPAYMSPEQASAAAIDARADQYSLATVLYEMLAGEPPFTGRTAQAILARRLAEPARALQPVRSTVPTSVESTVLKALERVPADRFSDVSTFASALRSTPALESRRMIPGPRSRVWILVSGSLFGAAALALWAIIGPAGRSSMPVTRNPEAVALYQRGIRGYDRRTPAGIADAVKAFGVAIERDSTYTEAWTGLAKTYVRAADRRFVFPGIARDSVLQLAVLAVERALALDPRSADAWLTQAMVSRAVDPTDNASVFRSIREALKLDSTDARAWSTLGLSLANSGDMNGALKAWRRSVAVNPTYTEGLAFLGLGHYWQRQYDSAAVWADSAIALDPNYLFGRTAAGAIAIERGKFARATAAFEAARRLSTEVEVVNALAGNALVEARAQRLAEARVILRQAELRAVAYSPAPLHTAVAFAQVYAALGEPDRALAWLKRYSPPQDLHFQLHLRCDPPFAAMILDHRFRSLVIQPTQPAGHGC